MMEIPLNTLKIQWLKNNIQVVFVILIALQINEWNDHRKQIKLEDEYYCRLLDDNKLDKQQDKLNFIIWCFRKLLS